MPGVKKMSVCMLPVHLAPIARPTAALRYVPAHYSARPRARTLLHMRRALEVVTPYPSASE